MRCDGDAAFSRRGVITPLMKEDSAPAAFGAGAEIVVQNERHVIKAIFAPHFFAAFRERKFHGPVVCSRMRVVTPAVILPYVPERYGRLWPPQPVGAEISGQNGVVSTRGCAIALALEIGCSRPADGTGNPNTAGQDKRDLVVPAKPGPPDCPDSQLAQGESRGWATGENHHVSLTSICGFRVFPSSNSAVLQICAV